MQKIDLIVNELKKYSSKVILFGSRARGDNLKTSDIDIAIDGEFTFREKRKIKEKIDLLAGIYSVDLIFLDDASNDLKQRIFSEGIIYDKK